MTQGQNQQWVSCMSGKHFWPENLEAEARNCCGDHEMVSLEEIPPPKYRCSGGHHFWPYKSQAERCCRGFTPVMETVGSPWSKENPFEVRQRVLTPTAELFERDKKAMVDFHQILKRVM